MFTSIRPRIRGSKADAPPWVTGPTSFPLHLCPPPLFPLIPLPHCREEDRNADCEPERWRTQNTLNIFTVTSILSLNHGVQQYVGSNYFDCRDKKKKNQCQMQMRFFFMAAPCSAFSSCCSDSLLRPMLPTTPAFRTGAFKPGQRNPPRPVGLTKRIKNKKRVFFMLEKHLRCNTLSYLTLIDSIVIHLSFLND